MANPHCNISWIFAVCPLSLSQRSTRCRLPHPLPYSRSLFIWHLRFLLARVQSNSHVHDLVWRSSMDRRPMCQCFLDSSLSIVSKYFQRDPELGNDHPGVSRLFHLLALIPPHGLATHRKGTTLFHCQGDCVSLKGFQFVLNLDQMDSQQENALTKSYRAPIGGFTYLIWALVRSKGIGPLIHEPARLQGSAAVFPLVSAMVSIACLLDLKSILMLDLCMCR